MADHEIAEKSRFWDSEHVTARLDTSFAPGDRSAAAVLLAGLVGEVPHAAEEDSTEASCRLMLDAIRVSAGDLYRLKLWVDAARMDPRDLIAAAEYRRELETPTPEARHEDLLEYVTWASGGAV